MSQPQGNVYHFRSRLVIICVDPRAVEDFLKRAREFMHIELDTELGVSMKELSKDVTAVVQMILTKLASMNFVAVPPNQISKAFDVYRRAVLMEAELLIDRATDTFLEILKEMMLITLSWLEGDEGEVLRRYAIGN